MYDTLVLSGGGPAGFLTLGSLEYFYRLKHLSNIKNYIGVSSGAILCYLLVLGYTPIEILVRLSTSDIMKHYKNIDIIGSLLQNKTIFSFTPVEHMLRELTLEKIGFIPTLKEMYLYTQKTVVFSTYNVTQDNIEYLSKETYPDMCCLKALELSSAVPLLFESITYNNNLYIDGGIGDNFSIDIGERIGTKILGIVLQHYTPHTDLKSRVFNMIFIPIRKITKTKIINSTDKSTIITLNSEKSDYSKMHITNLDMVKAFCEGYEKTLLCV